MKEERWNIGVLKHKGQNKEQREASLQREHASRQVEAQRRVWGSYQALTLVPGVEPKITTEQVSCTGYSKNKEEGTREIVQLGRAGAMHRLNLGDPWDSL